MMIHMVKTPKIKSNHMVTCSYHGNKENS